MEQGSVIANQMMDVGEAEPFGDDLRLTTAACLRCDALALSRREHQPPRRIGLRSYSERAAKSE